MDTFFIFITRLNVQVHKRPEWIWICLFFLFRLSQTIVAMKIHYNDDVHVCKWKEKMNEKRKRKLIQKMALQTDLPPLHTPFGNVDQPKPWPQGSTQARVAFASVSCEPLLKIATAASVRICALRTASRLLRLDETSEFVAAVCVNDTTAYKLKWE